MIIESPHEISKGVLACEIMDDSRKPLVKQTCRVLMDGNKIHLENHHSNKGVGELYDFIRHAEHESCEILSVHSEEWFGVHMPVSEVNALFKTGFHLPCKYSSSYKMTVIVPSDVEVYDHKRRTKPIETTQDKELTCLLHAKRLIVTAESAKIEWEVIQILVHEKKSPVDKELLMAMGKVSIVDEKPQPFRIFKTS